MIKYRTMHHYFTHFSLSLMATALFCCTGYQAFAIEVSGPRFIGCEPFDGPIKTKFLSKYSDNMEWYLTTELVHSFPDNRTIPNRVGSTAESDSGRFLKETLYKRRSWFWNQYDEFHSTYQPYIARFNGFSSYANQIDPDVRWISNDGWVVKLVGRSEPVTVPVEGMGLEIQTPHGQITGFIQPKDIFPARARIESRGFCSEGWLSKTDQKEAIEFQGSDILVRVHEANEPFSHFNECKVYREILIDRLTGKVHRNWRQSNRIDSCFQANDISQILSQLEHFTSMPRGGWTK